MQIQTSTIDSFDGRRLKVVFTTPHPSNATVLIALPFGIKTEMATSLYKTLAEEFNVVTWQARFVLDTHLDVDGDTVSASCHAQDLIAVAEHHQALTKESDGDVGRRMPLHLVGYCSGSGISLMAAALRPSFFQTLSLIAGEYLWPEHVCRKTSFQREADVLLTMAGGSMEVAKKLSAGIEESASGDPQSEFHEYVSLPFSSSEHLHRYGLNYIAYKQIDLAKLAGQVIQPTLLLASRKDCQVDISSSEYLATLLPFAYRHWMEEGDHYELCRANPDVVGALTEFIYRALNTACRWSEHEP